MRTLTRSWIVVLGLVAMAWLSSGCVTTIMATAELSSAEDALAKAEDAGAAEKAPYEFNMAREMVRKAQEEWGYSEFDTALDYAEKAVQFAQEAEARAAENPWTPPPPEVLNPTKDGKQGDPATDGKPAPSTPASP